MGDRWIIFIDTNIFLDFYRLPGESAKRQLAALEKHKDILITDDQVRMEFLKNRQKVILASMQELKDIQHGAIPQILGELKTAELLKKSQQEVKRRLKDLKGRAEKILENPARNDVVFKTFSRIFDYRSELNLCRPRKERFEIRNLARKRFSLGYPPRKPSDTSIGDAINWEWIIYCAKNIGTNSQVMIVSRDGDYGAQSSGNSYLNDWLLREFKDRVSRKRKIILTSKLTDALKSLSETVTDEDVVKEKQLIETFPGAQKDLDLSRISDLQFPESAIGKFILEAMKRHEEEHSRHGMSIGQILSRSRDKRDKD